MQAEETGGRSGAETLTSTQRRIWLVLLSIILVLALCELGVRGYLLVRYGRMDWFNTDFVRPHPFINYECYPDLDMMISGQFHLQTDENGFRNEPLPKVKAQNAFRIAFLGDSTTFSMHAHDNAGTYPALTGKLLQERYPGKKIEVINCGLHGYISHQVLLTYILKVRTLQPDLIVVYQANSDMHEIYNNSDEGYNKQPWTKQEHTLARWLRKSSFYQMLMSKSGNGLYSTWGRGNPEGVVPEGFVVNESKLDDFKNNMEDLIVVARKDGCAVLYASYAFSRSLTPEEFKTKGLTQLNGLLSEMCRRQGVAFFDFDAAYNQKYGDDGYRDRIHFDGKGTQRQAEMFAEKIAQHEFIR